MKISLLIIARNADIGGVNYKVAQKTILEHVAVKNGYSKFKYTFISIKKVMMHLCTIFLQYGMYLGLLLQYFKSSSSTEKQFLVPPLS